MISDEVTSLSPATGQRDWYKVEIRFEPKAHGIESKSLKLYLLRFRNKGIFAEHLASEIANRVYEDINPIWVNVTIGQKSRGGISIRATAGRGIKPAGGGAI